MFHLYKTNNIQIFIFFCIIYTINTEETCSIDDKSDCANIINKNKYTQELNVYKKYLIEIEKAKTTYKPCNQTKCSCHSSVILNDLENFKRNGITEELIKGVKSKGTKYQIIDHRLYRDKDCMFPARCAGIDHFLLQLASKLPDLELIINTRDWPQIHKQYGVFGPVFSFSKTDDYYDIMYPAWAFWEGGPAIGLYPTGIGRWDKHRLELGKIGNETAWKDKQAKAFFRGSRTSSERDALVLLSREQPELADAQYTKNQAWKSDMDTLHAQPAEEVSFNEHCKYKYLFNFRGVAASFRFKHILLCKSLVFHVGNEWVEFFYTSLKPWIHYIPVEANASKEKIKELIEFAIHYDNVVKEIAENGYKQIWNNLRMNDVTCYWYKLLRKYSKLLKYQPRLDNELIEIKKI